MQPASVFKKILLALGSRVARNIYLWAILLWFTHETNLGNERGYHHGIIRSSWYWWVILSGLVLQMVLVYVNNLLLIPRLLVRKKRWLYIISVCSLILVVSIIYTVGLKIANQHIDISHVQQLGMVSGPVTNKWTFLAIADELQTYVVGNMLWVLVLSMAWYMNDYARQRRIAEQALSRQTATELSFLKSQLNPHFLFNTLNNVYALALKQAADAPDAILRLSSILRYLLYESNTPLVSFEKEQEIMLAYIDLELLRIKDRQHMNFSITADRAYLIPPLLWLPILENVFKHGTRIINGEIFAGYHFHIVNEVLSIKASNYYRPVPEEGCAETGIGLANLRKRLELLYPGRYTFTTSRKDNTFTIEVIVKLA